MSAVRRSPALWLLLALFAAEFFLFDHFGSHRHTGVYPRWNDQIQYLSEAYTGYEFARVHGFAAGLWQTLVNPSAQGTLHDFFAVVAFTLAGPSRSAALALNLLALIAWQAALFVAVARSCRAGSPAPAAPPRISLAFAAAALPLALRWPWETWPGSAYDFRLDHLAMCAFGVTSATAWLTDGFRARGWSLVFGTAVGITLLTRFLTGTYFVVIFVALLGWILLGAQKSKRTANLALIAAVLAAPVFWLNREWVWNYYYIGHYVGPESGIRDPHMGFGPSLAFVWGNFTSRHLGIFFAGLAALGALALAVLPKKLPSPVARGAFLIGAVFLLAPAIVLTLHKQKSDVVLGALAPGAVLLVVALWLALARRVDRAAALTSFAAAVVVTALGFFATRQFAPAYDAAFLADTRAVNAAADFVFHQSRTAGLAAPRVAADYITDCLDGEVLRVVCYERHHVWLPFEMTLPTGIAAPDDALVMERLGRSDFVFLTEDAPAGYYPFDQKLAALRPLTRAWCETHLRAVWRFPLFGRRMVLYQRREIPFP